MNSKSYNNYVIIFIPKSMRKVKSHKYWTPRNFKKECPLSNGSNQRMNNYGHIRSYSCLGIWTKCSNVLFNSIDVSEHLSVSTILKCLRNVKSLISVKNILKPLKYGSDIDKIHFETFYSNVINTRYRYL